MMTTMNADQRAKHAERQRRWRAANKEKHRAYQRNWVLADPERAKAVSRKGAKATRERLRAEMIVAYGGACTCCGEDNALFLSIEHVGGLNGRPRANPVNEMRRLKAAGWPDECTLFCFNCNLGSWRNGGTCPHTEVLSDDAAS